MRGLQFEIPARLAVGIIYQHHAVFVLQPQRLLFDHFGILADESRAENVNDEGDDRQPGENIPGGAKIQAAKIVANGSDCGATGEPVTAGADLFEALVGQNEIDPGGGKLAGEELQDFVRRAVRRGRVRAHAKTVRNGLELFLFFADAVTAAPPPGLVHERAMRRVHQSDDGLIDAAGKIGAKMRDCVGRTERRQLRRERRCNFGRSAFLIAHEAPDVAVAFFAGECAGVNAFTF